LLKTIFFSLGSYIYLGIYYICPVVTFVTPYRNQKEEKGVREKWKEYNKKAQKIHGSVDGKNERFHGVRLWYLGDIAT